MSLRVQSRVKIIDITKRWELAQCLSGKSQTPERVLRFLFQNAMPGLEEILGHPLKFSMQEKIWTTISKERLKILNDLLISEFCGQILESLITEDQAGKMLEECRKTGMIQNKVYAIMLQHLVTVRQESITDVVIEKAMAMASEWTSNIIATAKQEGVLIPEHKQEIS